MTHEQSNPSILDAIEHVQNAVKHQAAAGQHHEDAYSVHLQEMAEVVASHSVISHDVAEPAPVVIDAEPISQLSVVAPLQPEYRKGTTEHEKLIRYQSHDGATTLGYEYGTRGDTLRWQEDMDTKEGTTRRIILQTEQDGDLVDKFYVSDNTIFNIAPKQGEPKSWTLEEGDELPDVGLGEGLTLHAVNRDDAFTSDPIVKAEVAHSWYDEDQDNRATIEASSMLAEKDVFAHYDKMFKQTPFREQLSEEVSRLADKDILLEEQAAAAGLINADEALDLTGVLPTIDPNELFAAGAAANVADDHDTLDDKLDTAALIPFDPDSIHDGDTQEFGALPTTKKNFRTRVREAMATASYKFKMLPYTATEWYSNKSTNEKMFTVGTVAGVVAVAALLYSSLHHGHDVTSLLPTKQPGGGSGAKDAHDSLHGHSLNGSSANAAEHHQAAASATSGSKAPDTSSVSGGHGGHNGSGSVSGHEHGSHHTATSTMRSGDTVWDKAESHLKVSGNHRPSVERIERHTRYLLHLNNISTEEAKHLNVGTEIKL